MNPKKLIANEDAIKLVLKTWATNTEQSKLDVVLENHADDVVIYDVLKPMKYEGKESYRKSWDDWQPDSVESTIFRFTELEVKANDMSAIAYGFIECGGVSPDGNRFEDLVRATFYLENNNNQWTVIHQHISKPM